MKFKLILKIKSLHIKNFKSIVDLTINEPNPFTVFVGPNGSGKSNIFEALEYRIYDYKIDIEIKDDIYSNIFNFSVELSDDNHYGIPSIEIELTNFYVDYLGLSSWGGYFENGVRKHFPFSEQLDYKQFIDNFSRLFVGNKKIEKIPVNSSNKLSTSADNLEKVLKRLLENKEKREEISEWLELFLPEFDRIEVQKSEFSSNENLLIYQKHYERPFNKELISDGTYNIIALLTAVYQSDEPQFLCIEEPENGLNPYVIRKLVDFFRNACAEKGHYIWLNTHSQTLVECLQPEEVIVVDKINGETQIKQIKGMNLHGLDMAEVWLSGALGGGTPW